MQRRSDMIACNRSSRPLSWHVLAFAGAAVIGCGGPWESGGVNGWNDPAAEAGTNEEASAPPPTPQSTGADASMAVPAMGDAGAEAAPDSAPPPPASQDVFSGAPPYSSQSGGSGYHNSGKDCMQCHRSGGATPFEIAGTIYDAQHAPLANVEVRLVDANQNAFSVYSGANGNFYKPGGAFASPAQVGARDGAGKTHMIAAVTKGACNSCHCSGSSCATVPIHVP